MLSLVIAALALAASLVVGAMLTTFFARRDLRRWELEDSARGGSPRPSACHPALSSPPDRN